MKVNKLLQLITDSKLNIEFIDSKGMMSYGFYTKNDLIYNTKFNNSIITSMNVQYIDNKRLLVLYIK